MGKLLPFLRFQTAEKDKSSLQWMTKKGHRKFVSVKSKFFCLSHRRAIAIRPMSISIILPSISYLFFLLIVCWFGASVKQAYVTLQGRDPRTSDSLLRGSGKDHVTSIFSIFLSYVGNLKLVSYIDCAFGVLRSVAAKLSFS